MHKKKYFILLIPTLIMGIILFIYLPENQMQYVLIAPIVFWIMYYSWIYVEKRQESKES